MTAFVFCSIGYYFKPKQVLSERQSHYRLNQTYSKINLRAETTATTAQSSLSSEYESTSSASHKIHLYPY